MAARYLVTAVLAFWVFVAVVLVGVAIADHRDRHTTRRVGGRRGRHV